MDPRISMLQAGAKQVTAFGEAWVIFFSAGQPTFFLWPTTSYFFPCEVVLPMHQAKLRSRDGTPPPERPFKQQLKGTQRSFVASPRSRIRLEEPETVLNDSPSARKLLLSTRQLGTNNSGYLGSWVELSVVATILFSLFFPILNWGGSKNPQPSSVTKTISRNSAN